MLSSYLSTRYAFKDDVITDDSLKEIGIKLWRVIKKYNYFSSFKNGDVKNIIVCTDVQEIMSLPWETIYIKNIGFALLDSINIYRKFTDNKLLLNTKINNMKTIYLSFNEDIDTSYEKKNLLTLFNNSIFFATDPLDKNIWNINPNVIIFSGHGEHHYSPHVNNKSKYKLLGLDNKKDILSLYYFNKETPPKMIFFNSCESSKNKSSSILDSHVYKLLKSGVSVVIGMREPVLDNAAKFFLVAFFEKLLVTGDIGKSMIYARNKIKLPMFNRYNDIRKNISYGQWAIPEIYIRDHKEVCK